MCSCIFVFEHLRSNMDHEILRGMNVSSITAYCNTMTWSFWQNSLFAHSPALYACLKQYFIGDNKMYRVRELNSGKETSILSLLHQRIRLRQMENTEKRGLERFTPYQVSHHSRWCRRALFKNKNPKKYSLTLIHESVARLPFLILWHPLSLLVASRVGRFGDTQNADRLDLICCY